MKDSVRKHTFVWLHDNHSLATATRVRCQVCEIWQINHRDAQSGLMWHQSSSRAVWFALMKCACKVSLFVLLCVCVCVCEGGSIPAFRMRKCVALWQWITDGQSQMFLRRHKARLPGPTCSVYWSSLMSPQRVLSDEIATESEPGTRICPTVLRTCSFFSYLYKKKI